MTVLEPRLRHVDGWPVMSITEAPQTMELTLTNRGASGVRTAGGTVTLRFRPGVLVDVDRIRLAAQTRGAWSLLAAESADGAVLTLTVRRTLTIRNGAAAIVRVEGLRPDERGGSRATRVQVDVKGFGGGGAPANGTRLMHLSVLRRHDPVNGVSEVPEAAASAAGTAASGPFLAGFIGGNGVLNDGESSTRLRLRVVNATGGALRLQTGDDATRFTLGYLTGDDLAPWGLLGSRHDHVSIELGPGSTGVWDRSGHTVHRIEPGPWRGGEALDLELTVDTGAAAGVAALVVGFENVPGHDDGDLVLPVQIGPVVADEAGLRSVRPVRLIGQRARLSFARQPNAPEPDDEAALSLDNDGQLRVQAVQGAWVHGDDEAEGVLGVGGPGDRGLKLVKETGHALISSGLDPLVLNMLGRGVGVGRYPGPGAKFSVQGTLDADRVRIGGALPEKDTALGVSGLLEAERVRVNGRLSADEIGVSTLEATGALEAWTVKIGGAIQLSVQGRDGAWKLVATREGTEQSVVLAEYPSRWPF